MSQRSPRVNLNPHLLTWARVSSGYDHEDIAKSVGVAPEVIAAWEQGDQRPTFRQLEKLANKVKRPVAALFLPKPPSDPPPPRDFRMLPETRERPFTPPTLLAFRQARVIQRDARDLAEALHEELTVKLASCSIRDDPEEVAEQTRALLGISLEEQMRWRDGYNALNTWRAALEEAGLIVLQFPMPLEDARGFTIEGTRPPVIGISSKDSPEARNFSLFHECCHVMLGYSGVSGSFDAPVPEEQRDLEAKIEFFCNRFAAAFLLPPSSPQIRPQLRQIMGTGEVDIQEVVRLARKFKVSRQVVLGTLLTQGLIAAQTYREITDQWRKEAQLAPSREASGGGDYVTLRFSQVGRRFTSLVLDALDSGEISIADASGYLAVRPEHFEPLRGRLSRRLVDE